MKKFFHRLFTQDMIRKVIALVLGLLLYNYIHGILYRDVDILNVPVEIQADSSLIVSELHNHRVEIRVRAPKGRIESLRANEFSGTVNVREDNLINGICEVQLFPKNFTAPRGVKVIDVKKKSLRLNVRRKITKEIAPVANYSGKLSTDLRCSATFSPAMVQLIGSEITLRDPVVKTEPIPLNESITESFDYEVALIPPIGANVEPAKVRATITVEPRYASKTIPQVPLAVLQENSPQKQTVAFETNLVNVVLKGPQSLLTMCNAENVRAYVDLTEIRKSGVYTLEPQCKVLTSGVTVSAVVPAEIRVKVK